MNPTFLLLLLVRSFVHAFPHIRSSSTLLSSRQADGVVEASSFLRRAYHSSAVLNRRVYIDGGEVSYKNGEEITYMYSKTLLWIDLTDDWENESVPLLSSPKPPGVPNLRHGGIWVDRSKGVLYTGFAGSTPHFGDQAFSPPGLWSFNPSKSSGGFWKSLNGSAHEWFTSQPRPSKALVASGRGYGFLLGQSDAAPWRSGSFITYDIPDSEMLDTSGIEPPGEIPIFAGTVYVPNWGGRGILIAVGGGSPSRLLNGRDISFETVHIYDVEAQRWYDQKTTGDIPQYRTDFCIAGAVSSNRTHEILVYGGWNGQLGAGATPYDSAYVLTLPAFHWARADYPPAHPRHGLSCDAVGGSQILAIGGVDTAQEAGGNDDAYTAGFRTPDPFPHGLAIFDLSTLTWSAAFRAKQSPQAPAPKIQDYYNTHGRTPATGFSSEPLQALFSTDAFRPTDDPGSAVSGASHRSSTASTGAIIGGTVGAVVGAALACWALAAWWKRRKVWRWRWRQWFGLFETSRGRRGRRGWELPQLRRQLGHHQNHGDGDDGGDGGDDDNNTQSKQQEPEGYPTEQQPHGVQNPGPGPGLDRDDDENGDRSDGLHKGAAVTSGAPAVTPEARVGFEQVVSVKLGGKLPGEPRWVSTDGAGRPVALYSPSQKVDVLGEDCGLREPVFEVEGDRAWRVEMGGGQGRAGELEGDVAWPVEIGETAAEETLAVKQTTPEPKRRVVGTKKRVAWKDS